LSPLWLPEGSRPDTRPIAKSVFDPREKQKFIRLPGFCDLRPREQIKTPKAEGWQYVNYTQNLTMAVTVRSTRFGRLVYASLFSTKAPVRPAMLAALRSAIFGEVADSMIVMPATREGGVQLGGKVVTLISLPTEWGESAGSHAAEGGTT
jgi:hypothetical protein